MSNHIPTLAEVCSAIAEGRLSVSTDGSSYLVSALELRRYFSNNYAVPNLLDSNAFPLLYAEHPEASGSNFCSVR
jgi:hypothetical protein